MENKIYPVNVLHRFLDKYKARYVFIKNIATANSSSGDEANDILKLYNEGHVNERTITGSFGWIEREYEGDVTLWMRIDQEWRDAIENGSIREYIPNNIGILKLL